jgi:hypothetical protein
MLTLILLVAAGWIVLGLVVAFFLGKVAQVQELTATRLETDVTEQGKIRYLRRRKRPASHAWKASRTAGSERRRTA